MSIFALKSIEALKAQAAAEGQHTLRRVLGRTQLIMLGIGAVIGAGIFVLTGQAAGANAGPAIVLSMLLAGIASALAGLCYAEFASVVPVAGSAYTYAYATLGEFIAWIIGWDLILEYALSAATVAVSWSGHLMNLLAELGVQFPAALSAAPGTIVPLVGGGEVVAVFNLPAVLIAALVTTVLVIGVRESATTTAIMVVVKVSVILAVIVGGVFYIEPANWRPFIPQNTGVFGEYGWSGIVRGAAVIFFAYIGFDAVSTAAQEARSPQRDLPVGILASLAICTFLYMAVSAVMVGLAPYTALKNSPAPMVVALQEAAARAGGGAGGQMLDVLRVLVEIGALTGLTSVMLVTILAQPRIFYAMSRDGLLPGWAGRLHPRFRTPHISTVVTGVGVALAAGFTSVNVIGQLVSIGTLFAFAIVAIGVIFLRYRRPDLERPFKTPFVPFTPIVSVLVSVGLMASLPWPTWRRLLIWMAIGLVFYVVYGYRKSVIRRGRNVEAGL